MPTPPPHPSEPLASDGALANESANAPASSSAAQASTADKSDTPDAPDAPDTPDALEPAPAPHATLMRLHMPVDVRSVSLALLALFASVAMLHWAAAVFIPVAMSVLMVSALSPAVGALQRWHIPRWLGAAVLLLALVTGLSAAAMQLSDGAAQVIESLPVAAQKVRDSLRTRARQGPGALEKVQKAASQIEQAAAENATAPTTKRGVQRVQIERSPLNIRDYLWSGTMGLVSALGQFAVVVFLAFFALASGDVFQHKLLRIAGPSLERRKVTLQVLGDITGQIQRYLLVQVLTSVIVGITTGATYAALGLENAIVWGVLAGVLNLVPYIGSIVVTGASALVAFLQFGSLDMALAIGGASLLIHTLVGNLLTPWLTSRTSSMSPVAVFVSVLAWGWLWGLWGLLLGIPIMMAVKTICDRVDDLKAIGELLGN
ncbi:MAG: AI-2E family transporter [Giesbergeria sp.]|nr:AI-2E family transporter [Giesbergeria sp.]MBP6418961.1 AI-2E family transporter [Giesbergeria sp.]